MGLLDFKQRTETVTFKGGSIDVRGLSLDDVGGLIHTHLPDLERLYEMYRQSKADVFTTSGMNAFVVNLTTKAPALVANLILLAADEVETEGAFEKARRLPLSVQIDALFKIGKLTFEDVGGPKNFFAILRDLVAAVQPTTANGSLTKAA